MALSSEHLRVPFIRPQFPDPHDIAADVAAIVERNWYTNMGPLEHELAAAMADQMGNGSAVSLVANGTLGLLLALEHLKVPGRRAVLVPSFTFTAAPQCALWCGLEPVFVDVSDSDWQPDADRAGQWLADHAHETAAILCANSFGVGGAHVDAWEELASAHGLPLIVDSAAGFGSHYPDGDALGHRGTCEVFSLHATKPFAVGEGGAVTSTDPGLIAALDVAKNFGFGADHDVAALGLNAKLPELTCAIGLRQLRDLKVRLDRRRGVLGRYHDLLAGSGVGFQPNDLASTVPFLSVLMPTEAARAGARSALDALGVEHRHYYEPVHLQTLFRGSRSAGPLAVTEDLGRRIMSLPVHDEMDDAVIEAIAARLRSAAHVGTT